jgi:hypothetical protein
MFHVHADATVQHKSLEELSPESAIERLTENPSKTKLVWQNLL